MKTKEKDTNCKYSYKMLMQYTDELIEEFDNIADEEDRYKRMLGRQILMAARYVIHYYAIPEVLYEPMWYKRNRKKVQELMHQRIYLYFNGGWIDIYLLDQDNHFDFDNDNIHYYAGMNWVIDQDHDLSSQKQFGDMKHYWFVNDYIKPQFAMTSIIDIKRLAENYTVIVEEIESIIDHALLTVDDALDQIDDFHDKNPILFNEKEWESFKKKLIK